MSMLNIDSLHRELDKRERRKLKIYDKILLKCHSRIKISTKKSGDTFCFFVIPTYVFGIPLFDISGCVLYIVENLIKNGFDVKYTHPNLIFISWHRKKNNQLQLSNNRLVRNSYNNQTRTIGYNNREINNQKRIQEGYKLITDYTPTKNIIYKNSLNDFENKTDRLFSF